MRIIQVLNSPNWSAASAYCVNVSAELIKLGHDVLLMTEPGNPMKQALRLGIPCDGKLNLNSENLFEQIKCMKHFKQVFKHYQPDVVSAHMNKGSWMPAFVAKKSCQKAVVVRVRADILAPNKHLGNIYINHYWNDHIVCSSELHKEVCHKNLWLSNDRMSVVYGCVDADKFNPEASDGCFRKEIGATDDDFLVCLLGRLSPVKGHEYAVKAIETLKDLPKKVKLLCVGYECERNLAWLKGEAERKGVSDRLIFVGRREDLPSILASVDVGIITSIGSEANSRATLEYMASGKPVISTRVGVIPELIVEGETGFITEIRDTDTMADRIKYLALNPDVCKRMGIASRKRIKENFTFEKFGIQMEKVYKKLVEKRSAS